jgi:FdhD protein
MSDKRAIPIRKADIGVTRVSIEKISSAGSVREQDQVCVEEPLEIRVGFGEEQEELTLSITMRTPGDDLDLAVGFLHGEGIVHGREDVIAVEHCGPPSPDKGYKNVVKVGLGPNATLNPDLLDRHFYTTSSCGVCGKTSLEAVNIKIPDQIESNFQIKSQALHQLPSEVRLLQDAFLQSGGCHAAALFNQNGQIKLVREDVGRHNAVDKVVGANVRSSLSILKNSGLFLSGRASFELIQKAALASIPLVCAVGPPSNLAIELAEQEHITLVGFLGESRLNVYCHPERVTTA